MAAKADFKRELGEFYAPKRHRPSSGKAAPIPDMITVPPYKKKDNPEGPPSPHPQPQ